jgi:hypothetical protein
MSRKRKPSRDGMIGNWGAVRQWMMCGTYEASVPAGLMAEANRYTVSTSPAVLASEGCHAFASASPAIRRDPHHAEQHNGSSARVSSGDDSVLVDGAVRCPLPAATAAYIHKLRFRSSQ